MEKGLISVIVPIYNVENYLERCLNSLVNQTYKNLEIILIDDGSTDNSGKKCDEFAKKDDRITVIHKENGGVSEARNMGLDIAKGEFINFIDPDDFVKLDFYEFFISTQREKNSDIVECGYVKVSEDELDKFEFPEVKEEYIATMNKFGAFSIYLSDDDEAGTNSVVLWNKLYKKEIFNELRFPLNKRCEDQFVMYQILDKCSVFTTSNRISYAYFQRNDSFMNKKLTEKRLDVFEAFNNFLDYLHKNNYEKLEGDLLHRYLKMCIEYANLLDKGESELKNKLIEIFNDKYAYSVKFISNSPICKYRLNRYVNLKSEFERIIATL